MEFSRGDELMYLSHLDLVRTFGRSLRRADIPMKYSEGFNPHAKMVFGLPMQVGVVGEAECLDIETEDGVEADRARCEINACLPAGLNVSRARRLYADENVMSIISHASYEMTLGWACGDLTVEEPRDADIEASLKEAVSAFLLPGPRPVDKAADATARGDGGRRKGTRGTNGNIVKTMDLAPLVRSAGVSGNILAMTVTAGSVNNVKPDMVLQAINGLRGGENGFVRKKLRRKALYVERDGVLYKPADDVICGVSV